MKEEGHDAVVILSGGVDSSTLLYYLVKSEGKKVLAITYNYGQRHDKELVAARDIAGSLFVEHVEVDLRPVFGKYNQNISSLFKDSMLKVKHIKEVVGDPQPATYIPNRNSVFLMVAAGIAESNGASIIAYGAQKHDLYGYWDTTPEYLEQINGVLALNRKNALEIIAPLVNLSKKEVVHLGHQLGVPFGMTWSCYEGGDKPCMKCATCAERNAAFQENGWPDPLWDKEFKTGKIESGYDGTNSNLLPKETS